MPYSYSDNYSDLYDVAKRNDAEQKLNSFVNGLKKIDINKSPYTILSIQDYESYKELHHISDFIKKEYRDVVIIGIGGSALNPKIATSFKGTSDISIHYLDTTDPIHYEAFKKKVVLRECFFLVISKSGNTIEVLSVLGAVLNDIGEYKKSQFCFLTGLNNNHIRDIANDMGAMILTHGEEIGGRFSTFSNVAILPGLLHGSDMKRFLEGSNKVLHDFWENKGNSLPAKSSASLFLYNKPIIVNIGYTRFFTDFLNWNSQIIGESLGKDGKGFTPIHNIGPIDQHSVFQLYLDGPRDKVFTFLYSRNSGTNINKIKNIPFLKNKTLEDVNEIEYRATLSSCRELGLPTRNILIDAIDEYSIGALAMHSIIEILTVAYLMDISPFGQPAVERIKSNIKALL